MKIDRTPLRERFIVKGQPVIYTGPASAAEIYSPSAVPKVLRADHPGRIFDPSPQHIRVEWFGLEDEPVSFASGFTRERPTRSGETGYVPGLAKIDEEEYEQLDAELRDRCSQGRCER